MGVSRNVSLSTALGYKGRGTFLTFILHRIGGLGMAIFIGLHIMASVISGEVGNAINAVYESWLFQLFIFFCVLFHAINGLRITIVDLWPPLIDHEQEAVWLEWAVFIPVYGLAAFAILRSALGG